MTAEQGNDIIIALVKDKDYQGLEDVLSLNSDDFDINRFDSEDKNALFYATELNDTELMKIILNYPRVNINAQSPKYGITALMRAAVWYNIEAMELLLERGADASLSDFNGTTALMLAAEVESFECVKLLVENGNCSIQAQCWSGENALMFGVDNYEISKLLIPLSDLSQADNYDATLLHMTCLSSTIETLKMILNLNVLDINSKNNNGETPLHKAIKYKDLNVVELLIRNGASLSVVDNNGRCAFAMAAGNEEIETFFMGIDCKKSEIGPILVNLARNGLSKALKSHLTKYKLTFEDDNAAKYLQLALEAAKANSHFECV